MKKLTLFTKAFSIVVLLLSVICCTAKEVSTQLQQENLKFEGEWIVSDYQENGVKTYTYDGDTVRIIKNDGVYYVNGPTWFFPETRFKLDRNMLVGTNIPDIERLRENWPTTSNSALGSAYGKIIFSGTLTMLQDDRIVVTADNWQIFTYQNSGHFQSVKHFPGFYSFVLTRKR